MSEQREPGWYHITMADGNHRYISRWVVSPAGHGAWTIPIGKVCEIGERIPNNEELKALRAVAEAAREFMEISGTSRHLSDAHEKLYDALARLGEEP